MMDSDGEPAQHIEVTDGKPKQEQDENEQLAEFTAGIRDQDDLERDIGRQADQLLQEQADERDQKRLGRTEKDKARLLTLAARLEEKLAAFGNHATKEKYRAELKEINAQIEQAAQDVEQIKSRMEERNQETTQDEGGTQKLVGETQRDYLIRTGKITPFSRMGGLFRTTSSLGDALIDAEDEEEDAELETQPESHRNLRAPGFEDAYTANDAEIARKLQEEFASERSAKRRRIRGPERIEEAEQAFTPAENSAAEATSDSEALDTAPKSRRSKQREQEDFAGIDDGNETVYQARLKDWSERRSLARDKSSDSEESEWHLPHPTREDAEFEGGLRIPGDIYPSLFDYQKTGVQWLWELYTQQVGGIVGDEMGLGKTIQVISFLAGLHYCKKLTKPVIVVCPATVMKQWVNEFHRWWPPMRVSILHTSGSGMLDIRRETSFEDDLETNQVRSRSTPGAKRVVNRVVKDGHVLVTTYSGLQTYADLIIPIEWGYAVLDEGHKIRNPNTSITIHAKELRTHNRLILSGTPIQNNLTELWSLFDFVFPMRLGTLVNFRNQFELPIKTGGYANASNLQVETAMKCAETLKDTISPYLLQRFKIDVAADLPKKTERVLFCKLTRLQRDTYEWFLASEEMKSILAGKRQALYGVDILRKICNHPDLVEHKTLSEKAGYQYGNGAKSGKMQVVRALLEIWKRHGHKTLLFAQHRIMLDILERFVGEMEGFRYRRMDGNTSIKDRQDLVDEFNNDPNLHVFLLTTKVGGLGVNLTGADRVIIYDPDWNPSTDIQARERAWRLGQKREVEIYRLMTAGTIEEKIYHRQIFKQFLTNKILRDPKQRQTFQLKDLHDLFTLGSSQDGQTETGSIFKGSEVQLKQSLPTPPAENDFPDITGVSRNEKFHEEAEGDKSDDRVLSSIFARTGVQSALEHDAIINGKKKVTADPEIIAKEARRVAAKAALELQKAGEIAKTVPAGVPTWTGEMGTSGRPDEPAMSSRGGFSSRGRGRGGPSSASVLANLSARQGLQESSRAGTPSRQQPKGKDFLLMIRDFLIRQGGQAHTQMLIDHFNRYCGTAQRTAEFKEMLKTIAVLEKGGRGRGKWVLRDEYNA